MLMKIAKYIGLSLSVLVLGLSHSQLFTHQQTSFYCSTSFRIKRTLERMPTQFLHRFCFSQRFRHKLFSIEDKK